MRVKLRELMQPMHEHLPQVRHTSTLEKRENLWLCYLVKCISLRTLIKIVDIENNGINGEILFTNAIEESILKCNLFESSTENGICLYCILYGYIVQKTWEFEILPSVIWLKELIKIYSIFPYSMRESY